MEFVKTTYKKALDSIGELPSWSDDWRWAALYSGLIYLIVLACRLSFASRWDQPELWVHGERIMATHDAYFWLAKAKGVGLLEGYPLAQFAKFLHDITGLSLGTVGFWVPAFLGSLVSIVCYFWGWFLGGRNAGIMAGLAGAMTPGFYFRSRLGYYDSDLFTLLMPMLVALLLAYWASQHIKSGWFRDTSEESHDESSEIIHSFWLAFAFGLVTRLACIWHHDILNVTILYFFLTTGVVLLNAKPGRRAWALYGLVIFALAAYPGASWGRLIVWPITPILLWLGVSPPLTTYLVGIVLSILCVVFASHSYRRNISFVQNVWVATALLVAVVFSIGIGFGPIMGVLNKLSLYFFPAAKSVLQADAGAMGPIYPSIVQSIIEAKLIPLATVFERGIFFSWLGYLSLLCTFVVVAVRPVAIFLLPLVVLQLASMKLGVRFTMFGGAALVIYISVCLDWLLRSVLPEFSWKKYASVSVQILAGGSLLTFAIFVYSNAHLTPVIPKEHAEALVELGEEVQPDSMIWTWWDWGYASQYYAGLETVIDGGKHAGRDIYPVAFTLATDSFAKANSMVRFSAQSKPKNTFELGLSPALVWDTIPRKEMLSTLQAQLEKTDYPKQPSQYFVVSWRDVSILKWLTYFGNWNLQTGTTEESKTSNYDQGELGYNLKQGAFRTRRGGGALLSDITVLDRDSAQVKEYYMNRLAPQLSPVMKHLVINMVSKQSVLMDRDAHESILMRLLAGDPNDPEISKHFKLVVDKLPFARIYEVVQ